MGRLCPLDVTRTARIEWSALRRRAIDVLALRLLAQVPFVMDIFALTGLSRGCSSPEVAADEPRSTCDLEEWLDALVVTLVLDSGVRDEYALDEVRFFTRSDSAAMSLAAEEAAVEDSDWALVGSVAPVDEGRNKGAA